MAAPTIRRRVTVPDHRTISKASAPSHSWGEGCQGWTLADARSLHVMQERMPPRAVEVRHLHRRTSQFCFVLEGRATIDLDGVRERLRPGEGVEIPAGAVHQLRNDFTTDLEFMVVSTGRPREDRVDLEGG